MAQPRNWQPAAAIAAILFGLLTIASGGKALFGDQAAQAAVGNAVPLVLWFNFLAGFVYVAGGAALWLRHPAARPVAWGLALATLGIFGIFLILVLNGTPFELRTVGAMILRSGFWLAIAIALRRK